MTAPDLLGGGRAGKVQRLLTSPCTNYGSSGGSFMAGCVLTERAGDWSGVGGARSASGRPVLTGPARQAPVSGSSGPEGVSGNGPCRCVDAAGAPYLRLPASSCTVLQCRSHVRFLKPAIVSPNWLTMPDAAMSVLC